jgi:dolichol-phosphate mannosyltransferase
MNPPRILVMTATYNEIDNISQLFDEVFAYLPEANFLVVDDNSPDGTGRWVKERSASDSRVHLIERTGKLGLGTAITTGMRWAIEHGYDYVVNIDADFSHHPRYLRAIVEAMDPDGGENKDVVIGSRYIPNGGITGWPWHRHFMSRAVNFYARWLLWLHAKDCSGGYRCYRTSTLAKLDLSTIRSRGYSFQEEILWRLQKVGARIGESPIIFADRERGQSKINMSEAFNALGIIARLGILGS